VRATYKKIRAGAYEFPGDTSGGCTPGVSVDTAGGSIPGPGTRDCLPPGGSDGVGTGQTLTESIGKANSQTSLGKQSNTNPPVHATRLGKNAEHLIKWCLAPKPEHRPSLVEIASHPFMLVGAPEWRLRSELTVVHATGVGTSERTKSPLIRTESPLKAKASSESRSGSPFKTHATRAPLSPLPVNAKLRRNDGNGMGNRDAQRAKPVSPATPKSPPPSVPRAFDVLRDLHGDLFGGTQAPRRALEDGTTGADAVHAVPAAAPHPSSLSRPPGPIPLPVPSVASLNLDTSHSSLSASPELATRILGNTSPSPLGAAALGAALQKTTSGGGGGASTAAGDATTPEPCRASNPTFVSFPPIWVTKWVDYTSKYGTAFPTHRVPPSAIAHTRPAKGALRPEGRIPGGLTPRLFA
jgi:serine/threonine protein kinase